MSRAILFLFCIGVLSADGSALQTEQVLDSSNYSTVSSLKEAFEDSDMDGVLDREEQKISVRAIAIYDSKLISEDHLISYVFDSSRAGMIYAAENIFGFEKGDSLLIYGTVFTYHGMPEIIIDRIEVISPAPQSKLPITQITAETELISLLGAPISSEFLLLSKEKLPTGSIRMKVSLMEGSSNEFYVFIRTHQVEKKKFDVDRFKIGDRLSINGVLGYYQDDYGYESFQIYPESPSDIRLVGIPAEFLFALLIGFCLLITAVITWNYSLRKKIDRHTKDISVALNEKTVLLSEVHHRVKNNLAVVSGFLQLEMMKGNHQESVKKVLDENVLRIKSMGYIHEQLYKSQDFSSINMKEYIKILVNEISNTYQPDDKEIELLINCDDINLNMNQAIPCALTINELLSNAYKHAFTGKDRGTIDISVTEQKHQIYVKVKDDGVGLPKDINLEYSDSLGMLLVHQFVAQLESELSYQNTIGSVFSFAFDKDQTEVLPLKNV